jgi:TRAP-type C4-dicarboxylate transport system permease small subunit
MIGFARTVFDRAMDILAGILIVTLLVCVTLGIVTRALGDPLIWTDEVSRFLMLWVAVCGWVIASRRQAHIRIRFFHDLLPRQGWRAAETVMQIAMIVFGLLAGWYSIHLVAVNHDLEATTVPISMGTALCADGLRRLRHRRAGPVRTDRESQELGGLAL